MLLLAAILGIGLLLGWGFGGRLRNLGTVRIHLWPLALVGLVLQVVPVPRLAGTAQALLPVGVVLLSYAVLLFFVAVNWWLRGFLVIGVGLLLNAAVIAANLGMPVSEYAVRQSGQAESIDELTSADDPKHHLSGEGDVLLPLADVIPVGSPFNIVVSVGDVVSYVGAAVFLAAAMLGSADRRSRSPGRPVPGRARKWGTQQ
ncbi:MAG TPA: DUF5317 domain-containing protein [Actinomycetota bacterium]|nr:DUF5317 domain-containing protein [Actinomycetota bacterium]